MMKKKFFMVAILALLFPTAVFAAFAGDLSISSPQIRFSTPPIEGRPTRIYATVSNTSSRDLLGSVRFFNVTGNTLLGTTQPVSLFAHKTDDVFIDWTPADGGDQLIRVTVIPAEPELDNPANNSAEKKVFVEPDSDHDGKINTVDPDDDNDGVEDKKDAFPLNYHEQYDADKDGIGDNKDMDDNNDGIPDKDETKDYEKDGVLDIHDTDDDNDGIPDISDAFPHNLKPEVKLSPVGIVNPSTPVVLDAGASVDPDGQIVSYQWSIDGTLMASADPKSPRLTHTFQNPGKHLITVTAKDSIGESITKTFSVYSGSGYFSMLLPVLLFLLLLILALFVIIRYAVPAHETKHSPKILRSRRRSLRLRK